MKLSGLIYVHRISDVRMGGISSRNFRMFRKLCGDDTLKNVVIVTNTWSEVGQAKGEMREAELKNKFFKPALDKGAQMLRHDNTVQSAHNISFRTILFLLKSNVSSSTRRKISDRRLLHKKSKA
jgi:hypothetical protein